MARLNEKRISKLVKQGPGRHRDVGGPIRGLVLQVTATGTASWLLRYQRDGRERWHGLGPVGVVGLKDARERARAARLLLLDDKDPIDTRQAARETAAKERSERITFHAAAEESVGRMPNIASSGATR